MKVGTGTFENEVLKIEMRLAAIQESFRVIRECGLDEEILVAYLRVRTGMGRTDIMEVLKAQDEFFKKLSRLGARPKSEEKD